MSAMSNQVSNLVPLPAGRPALEASPLFRGIDKETLAHLQQCSEIRRVPARETLHLQGERGKTVFVLLEGSVKVTRRAAAREHVERLAGVGEVLAESVLFSDGAYGATAVALEESRVLAVEGRRFVAQVRRDPRLAWNLLQRLGRRVEELETRTELLATHTAEQKVAAYLMNRYRSTSPTDAVIPSSCRRSDLASLLALAPETLCRVITEFKRRGWIRSENGAVLVTDPEALAGAVP